MSIPLKSITNAQLYLRDTVIEHIGNYTDAELLALASVINNIKV